MMPNCNTLTRVSGEQVDEPKVKPYKYADDLPLFSHFDLIPVSFKMVVLMEVMFVRMCDIFGILKPMVVAMVRFDVMYMTHIARSTL